MASRLWAGVSVSLVSCVRCHMHQQFPISRQYGRSLDFHNSTFEDLEDRPYSFNAGGVKGIQARAIENTDPTVLAEHGGGDVFPLYFSPLAENGNYLEPEEVAVRKGVCGDPRLGRNETEKIYSTPNSEWPVVAEFGSGDVIEMDVLVVYFHWGHVEFFICDVNDMDDPDGVVTQECLNKHPLDRAPYTGSGSPIDPSYPGRYYLDPPCRKHEVEQSVSSNFESDLYEAYNVKMRYVLPDIACEHCVLQMHWMTGDRCKHIGYDEFNPPSWNSDCAQNKVDWVPTDHKGICGVANSYPEEFWGCSDIKITAGATPAPSAAVATEATSAAADTRGTSSPTATLTAPLATHLPTAAPTPGDRFFASFSPTSSPTATPTATPTVSPTPTPTVSPTPTPTVSPTPTPTEAPTATPAGDPTATPAAAGFMGGGGTPAPAIDTDVLSSGAPPRVNTTFGALLVGAAVVVACCMNTAG